MAYRPNIYCVSRNDLDCSGGGFGDALASDKFANALWACKVNIS